MKKQRNRIQPGIRAKYDRGTGLVRLNVPLSVKAETIDKGARTFEGLAATWDEDLGADIIHKKAFKNSIAEWKASTEAMPLLNSHDQFDIFSALGQAVAMKETDEGLWTKWEVLEGDDGDRVLQRLRPSPTTGRAIIGKMSIGFYPIKYDYEQPEGSDSFFDRKRHIYEASLKEVSLVLFPMNPNASIDATTVKSFMQLARHTDPAKMDGVTRMELRRLNSRIGLLLAKQKPNDDEEVEDTEEARKKPSTQTPAPKVPDVNDSDDSTDDTDDLDELSDDLEDPDDLGPDGDEDDEADDSADDGDKPADAPPPTDKAKEEKPEEKVDPKTQPYIYSEALQKRLQKVVLQRKVSDAMADD